MRLWRSTSTNPYFHLAVEEWLLRQEDMGEEGVWFIYQNRPSVVLGRFQNPWLECDLGLLQKRGHDLVRRFSGGGTVWHDAGNVNFCHVRPFKGFPDKTLSLKKLQAKLSELGIDVVINQRHDLVIREADGTRKVSGSAYKQTKDRFLHHGTLLINADLGVLNQVLRSPHTLSETRSIPSVRSAVANLTSITPDGWIKHLEKGASELVAVHENDSRFNPKVWSDWSWQMGETPAFKWQFTVGEHEVRLSSRKGLIEEMQWVDVGEWRDLQRPLRFQTFSELSPVPLVEAQWLEVLGI